MPVVRITVDGKLALTVEQAAQRYGLAESSMRVVLVGVEPAAPLDRRKSLYLAARLDKLMAARPGKGAPGVPRPHKPAMGSELDPGSPGQ